MLLLFEFEFQGDFYPYLYKILGRNNLIRVDKVYQIAIFKTKRN